MTTSTKRLSVTLLRHIETSLMDIQKGNYIEFGSITEFKTKLKEYKFNQLIDSKAAPN